MRRPQFTIRTLLVAMLVVAAFFGGMAVQHRITGFQETKRESSLRQQLVERINESRQLDNLSVGLQKKVMSLEEQLAKERRKKSAN
jgi:hypothetical protein